MRSPGQAGMPLASDLRQDIFRDAADDKGDWPCAQNASLYSHSRGFCRPNAHFERTGPPGGTALAGRHPVGEWHRASYSEYANDRQTAEPARQRGRGQARFDQLDDNRDGRLSRTEFPLGESWFVRLDDNRDGFVSRQEFRDRRTESGGSDSFAALDRNNDGRIVADEWQMDRTWFARLDDDGDGSLTRDELFDNGSASPPPTSTRFDALDRNRDDRIGRGEWEGERGRFDALDDDRDGYVTRAEFASRADEAPGGDPARFDAWDHDNDGRLEIVAEWHSDGPAFAFLDVNRDGVISRTEYFGYGVDPRAHQFSGWDTNNDGRVSRQEWQSDDAAFKRLDDNRDGAIGRAEFLDRQGEPRAERFTDWDHDRNGVLARSEWHGPQAEFDALDRDRGGGLERSRFARAQTTSGTVLPLPGRFEDWDQNRDGRLVRSEWRAGETAFAAADRSRDGTISRSEFGTAQGGVDSWLADINRNRDGRVSSSEWVGARTTFTWLNRSGNGVLEREELLRGREHLGAWAAGDAAFRAGFNRGVVDGLAAGRQERQRNQRYDLEGQRELERADAGYASSIGSREPYQAGYRAGFRAAYRDGFDGR